MRRTATTFPPGAAGPGAGQAPRTPTTGRACSIITLLLLLLAVPLLTLDFPTEAIAAEEEAVAAPRETVFTLMVKGGWLMIPIGLCSVIVVTWTLERLISLRRARVSAPGLLEEVFETLPRREKADPEDAGAAAGVCDASDTVVGRVLRVGVEKSDRDESHAQTFLEEAAAKEVHVVRRSLRPFEICAAVAPLLGLLGTIFGMIRCFEKTTLADTASRAETLATGIYQALVTTAAGLCVAIPALVIHHYFLGRLDRIQDLVEETASEFLDHYYGTGSARRRRHGSSGEDGERSFSGARGPAPGVVSTHEGTRTGP